ncbi:TetR family transcriptional regulator [Amycolatopsis endophytica]|uniref:AcrR family transcriptional regulator n=1 Tax=Amycolatopsis endophytica TaxID=860233 RepID=A0A853B2H2_9PSEU|nr:TetR family transcriptional regulator [Amycolatopsis endophytica]NYI89323.1 AcrR family transcriptional regulator [Amycolatopsis endophytica]
MTEVAPEAGRRIADVSAEPVKPVSRQERKQRTRQALLDAALAQLADRPFAVLSLREVTKRAEIVPTAFYRHFTSMDELGLVLLGQSMDILRRMLDTARDAGTDLDDVVHTVVTTLHDYTRKHETHFRFLTRERHGGTGAVPQAARTELRLFAGELAIDLARFGCLRSWRNEDLRMLAELIVTMLLATALELIETVPETDERVLATAEKRLKLIALGAAHWK